MPFYGNACIQTWVITYLDEHFEVLDDAEKIEMMDLFRDDEGWFDDDKWGKIAWDNYEDILMEGIDNDMLLNAIKHSFLNEEEYNWELHSHLRGVFEEYEENLTKKTEEDEEAEYICCVCSNIHIPEKEINFTLGGLICDECYNKPDEQEAEETCVKCKETKTEDWYYNTTDVKNAPVCEDCRDKDDAAKNLKGAAAGDMAVPKE